MELLEYTTQIILDIPDLVYNDTIIKRKAEVFNLVYNLSNKFVSVTFLIKHYSNNNDAYGDYLPSIPDKLKEIVADNTIIVDSSTGQIIKDVNQYQDENGSWTIDVIGQYDFFNRIGENYDVNIHNLIRSYASQADWDFNLR